MEDPVSQRCTTEAAHPAVYSVLDLPYCAPPFGLFYNGSHASVKITAFPLTKQSQIGIIKQINC
jgi:hypothetical protein